MTKYLALFLSISLFTNTLHAQITLDGTLGPSVILEGPEYQIDAHLGQQQGGNLFHSFGQFNINSGETAIFNGPNSVTNVIGRVTGGTSSNINGTLKSNISHADIYLINPAGLLFGPDAKLDVLGSFHASTADALHFTDGSEFNARNPTESLLTVAQVSAFRFLAESPQSVTVNQSQLSTPAEQTLSLIGGSITTNGGTLTTPSGRINLASIAKPGEVTLKPQDLVLSASAGDINLQGTDIIVDSISSNGEVISSSRSGNIYIRGGQFEIGNYTRMTAHTEGNADGGEINIQADDLVHRGSLISHAKANGPSSRIKIKVFGSTQFSGGSILLRSRIDGGNLGNIDLETGTLYLEDQAYIKTLTNDSGQGGNIHLRATESITLSGTNTRIEAETNSKRINAGSGGTITLETPQLYLEDGAEIKAITSGAGKAADIKIEANNVTLHGGSRIFSTSDGSGNGGAIVLKAEQLILEGINTSSEDENKGQGNRIATSAESEMADAGDSGTMTLTLEHLKLADGAQIGASTFGPGQGGEINITVTKEAVISGQDQQNFRSGLFTSSQNNPDSTADSDIDFGNGGYIHFKVGDLYLTDNAEIYARTWGSGLGGNIDIDAQTINLASDGRITAHSKAQGNAGQILLTIRDRLQMRGNSQIETSAQSADGGNLAITASNYIYLVNSKITTSVSEEFGEGGNIDLNPEFVVLNGSEIIAKAKKGKGGDINITTTGIYNFTGEPIEKVINASSEYNEDGIVTINTPDNNGEEGLLVLPSTFIDVSALLDTPCSHRIAENLSSFATVPTEGVTNAPNDLLSNPALLLKPSPLDTVAATKNLETTAIAKSSMIALTTTCHPNNSVAQGPQTMKKNHLISGQLF